MSFTRRFAIATGIAAGMAASLMGSTALAQDTVRIALVAQGHAETAVCANCRVGEAEDATLGHQSGIA